jgi:hypothetical protein
MPPKGSPTESLSIMESDNDWEGAPRGYSIVEAPSKQTGGPCQPNTTQALHALLESCGGLDCDGPRDQANQSSRDFRSSLRLFLEPGEPYKVIPIHHDRSHQPYEDTIKVLIDRDLTVAKGFMIITPELDRYAEEHGGIVCCCSSSSFAVCTY